MISGPLGEDFVFESVFRWMQHDPMSRRECLPHLIKYLNLSAVTVEMKNKWGEECMRFDGMLMKYKLIKLVLNFINLWNSNELKRS